MASTRKVRRLSKVGYVGVLPDLTFQKVHTAAGRKNAHSYDDDDDDDDGNNSEGMSGSEAEDDIDEEEKEQEEEEEEEEEEGSMLEEEEEGEGGMENDDEVWCAQILKAVSSLTLSMLFKTHTYIYHCYLDYTVFQFHFYFLFMILWKSSLSLLLRKMDEEEDNKDKAHEKDIKITAGKRGRKGVEDEFFKLSEMEDFLRQSEKAEMEEDNKIEGSDEEDEAEDIDPTSIHYRDFFDIQVSTSWSQRETLSMFIYCCFVSFFSLLLFLKLC